MQQDNYDKSIIAWFANNTIAANLLMFSVIALGLLSVNSLRKEAFPPWPSDTVTVSMVYDSGAPRLAEEGIAIKIEEALAEVLGIKRITSISNTTGSRVSVEMKSGHDLDVLLRDVKAKVDAIYSFPSEAEKPVIEKQSRSDHAYSVKIYGIDDQHTLQTIAEQIRVDLLALDAITQVSIVGKMDPMISVEIDEQVLQAYGLSLSDVRNAINAESASEVSTSLRDKDKVVFLQGAGQSYYASEFANTPILNNSSGQTVRLSDVSKVSDVFDDRSFVLTRYNGQRGIGLEISVDERGDVINIVEQADKVIEQWKSKSSLPLGIEIETWNDGSGIIVDRLSLLIENAATGIVLVFIMLALFLNLRVAFWVTAGLPFIFCGTLFFMGDQFTSMSINEMTTFGFILALGIVVDDAIVVGESIYSTRVDEGDTVESTIKGARRVAAPTIFGVLTTVVTFVALSNVSGGMGHVYSQFAVVVTICLLLSVVESKLVLPAHLKYLNTQKPQSNALMKHWRKLQEGCDKGLKWFNQKIYRHAIRWVIQFRYAAILLFASIFVLVLNMPASGVVRTVFFPEIPGSSVSASISMQNDSSYGLTQEALMHLEAKAIEVDKNMLAGYPSWGRGSAIATIETSASGDASGTLTVELADDSPYDIKEFANRWRAITGNPEGVKKLNISSGFGGRVNFRVELKAWSPATLNAAGAELRQAVSEVDGVYGIEDNFNSGQGQLRFQLNEQGRAVGLSNRELSLQLLQAFGGEVVQRFQRGKDEVKVRVRYPEEDRKTIADVLNANIRLSDGTLLPLSSVANVEEGQLANERTRISGLPAYHISANVNKDIISSNELVDHLKTSYIPGLMVRYPDLQIHFAGEAEQQAETSNSMAKLFMIAMLAIFILLAIPLRSYIQPLIIMSVIPFGLTGAILGHWINDMPLSILSFNGLVALSGVVVNDSLLLVSRINENRKKGWSLIESVYDSCLSRLRPVLLTSLTTFVGLLPLLSETSPQAQFIIPAAVSLGYGILFATVITLLIVPALVLIQEDFLNSLNRLLPSKVSRAKNDDVAYDANSIS